MAAQNRVMVTVRCPDHSTKALVITADPDKTADEAAREIVADLREFASQSGWRIDWRSVCGATV